MHVLPVKSASSYIVVKSIIHWHTIIVITTALWCKITPHIAMIHRLASTSWEWELVHHRWELEPLHLCNTDRTLSTNPLQELHLRCVHVSLSAALPTVTGYIRQTRRNAPSAWSGEQQLLRCRFGRSASHILHAAASSSNHRNKYKTVALSPIMRNNSSPKCFQKEQWSNDKTLCNVCPLSRHFITSSPRK